MTGIPEQIWEKLLTIANEDGVISTDEEIMLENIKQNLKKYYDARASNDEGDELLVLQHHLDIMREAYDTAYLDDKLSEDELQLLKGLQKIVNRMAESFAN